jgi:2-aminoadipate transaminase
MSGYWPFSTQDITWSFDSGLPDPTTFPIDDLTRLSAAVLRDDAAAALQYGTGHDGGIMYGYMGLRHAIAERANARDGTTVDERSIVLTSGGIQGISLGCRAFMDQGDVVAVEAPTWGAVLMAANQLGAEVIAVPMDDDGMRVDQLEEQLATLQSDGKRLKMLYTIATFNTPTGLSMSADRRRRLVELAEQWGFLVMEDNVYGDLRYQGERLPTLRSLDQSGLVFTIESFSKTLAPGLRLGWVNGHPEVVAALSSVRGDLGMSQWLSRLMERYLLEGLLDPHIAQVNELYRSKRDVAVKALEAHCSPWVRWAEPEGGFFLWLELDPSVDVEAVRERALEGGVACRPGERFFGDADDGRQFLRLAFSMVPVEEIERGIAVLGGAIAAGRRV